MLSFALFALWMAAPPQPISVTPLEGATHHVQGIVVDGTSLWVTSVDRLAKKGYLFEFELATGKRLRSVEVQQGAMFHPGGFDMDDDSLWIPVAEYKKDGHTVIQRRSKATLAILSTFTVDDHIGCLTLMDGHLIGGNWDARKFYEWSFDGRFISVRNNPNASHYQEIKYRYGTLMASGGVVHWLDPEELEPLRTYSLGKSDRNVPYTNEGMDFRDGKLYLLPEDGPSRLFIFDPEQVDEPVRP